MSYRPITDVWILARPKVKYYGAYPAGFPERARALLGVSLADPVLHVCGGYAHKYPYKAGFGPNDKRLDVNPLTLPDFLADATQKICCQRGLHRPGDTDCAWPAILIDPPYTIEDARQYGTSFPEPNILLRRSLDAVRAGGRVGFLHYIWPHPPKTAKPIACIGVIVGFNNRMRCYSVFERT